MRSVSVRLSRGGALLLILAVLAVPAAFADDDGNPYEAPEARVQPPIGATANDEPPGFFDVILDWWIGLFARAQPPIG